MNKHILYYLSCVVIVVLVSVAAFFMTTSHIANDEVRKNLLPQGIRLSHFSKNLLVVTLQIEKIQFTGKKKGFLRLGFWKIMRFDDFILDVYPPVSGTILDGENLLKLLTPYREDVRGQEHNDSTGLVVEIAEILGLSSRLVKGLEMHHILWRIHENNLVAFKISSQFADYDFNHKSIIFKGRVKVEAGKVNRILETTALEWKLERGILEIPCAYNLRVNEQHERGPCLKTDLFLNKLEDA